MRLIDKIWTKLSKVMHQEDVTHMVMDKDSFNNLRRDYIELARLNGEDIKSASIRDIGDMYGLSIILSTEKVFNGFKFLKEV